VATFLFDKIVFGPVQSRRLGISLGINLLPLNRKICNFDCIYCECGLNDKNGGKSTFPTRDEVYNALKNKLLEMGNNHQSPDVITFAGNGEPTLHPEFPNIIEDTLILRNNYAPSAKISVLSNATMLHLPEVVDALKKIDQNILKLDSGIEETIQDLNKPGKKTDIQTLINQFKLFKGRLIIQSLFTKGEVNGKYIDNTRDEDLQKWLLCLEQIKPEMVMIYTIDRDTPYEGLKKIPVSELQMIAGRVSLLGIKTQVSG
jgi:wyosine [tRNA(Phe)-imidazoG37] synthetase (radical SAM superfamily)